MFQINNFSKLFKKVGKLMIINMERFFLNQSKMQENFMRLHLKLLEIWVNLM